MIINSFERNPATAKVPGMSTGEQGTKKRCKVEKHFGKSLHVVVFTFLEAGAAKPRTQSCTKSIRPTGRH